MIARLWHGITSAQKGDDYFAYLQKTGIPDYENTPGNQGVYVLRRIQDDQTHFLLISLWDSKDAIRQFSGSDIEKAVYYPEDDEFLLEKEPTVTHFEVIWSPTKPD